MRTWKQTAALRAILAREVGTIHKDHGGKLKVALAYPNSYHVGMSSLALHILYRGFNSRPDVVCERVFWDEAAAGQPLLSLESQTPVQEFDVLAFTLSFELDYLHVVAMLRQAGLEPLAERRQQAEAAMAAPRTPLLIAGGPAVSANPEPMAPFFDAIVIGEGEEILPALTDLLVEGVGESRQRLLDALDTLPGVYVPSRLTPAPDGRRIQRLWVRDSSLLHPVSCLYTPDTEFPNRHLVEIARGCGRGCRFCLAGYVYRPPREQPLPRILEWVKEGMEARGGDGFRPAGIGLISAAVSDHSQIDELAEELQALGVRISISSMRADPISIPMLRALAASGTQTLTIAPEAGSERLRRVIGKEQSESDLLAAVELAQKLGFPQLKLYFMVGHPGETEEDIEAIINLTLKARAIFRRNLVINATPFVPKAHTPFQWEAMTPAAVVQARQNRLRRALARHSVAVNADPASWAAVQGVLARGDRRLAPALLEMERPTARSFYQALARHGLDAETYLAARDPNGFQPWQVVDGGVRPDYLRREHRLALAGQPGHRCPPGALACAACGVCRVTLAPPGRLQ